MGKLVRDEGMPSHGNPFVKGNMFVLFRVDFPSNGELSASVMDSLRKLLPNPSMDLDYDPEQVEEYNLTEGDVKSFGSGGAQVSSNEYDSDDEQGARPVQCQQSLVCAPGAPPTLFHHPPRGYLHALLEGVTFFVRVHERAGHGRRTSRQWYHTGINF